MAEDLRLSHEEHIFIKKYLAPPDDLQAEMHHAIQILSVKCDEKQ